MGIFSQTASSKPTDEPLTSEPIEKENIMQEEKKTESTSLKEDATTPEFDNTIKSTSNLIDIKSPKPSEDIDLKDSVAAATIASAATAKALESSKKENSEKRREKNMKRLKRIAFLIKWAIKLGIIKITLDYTIEKGVWGNAVAGEKAKAELSDFVHALIKENISEEASENIRNVSLPNVGQQWNSAVISAIESAKDVDVDKMYNSLKNAVEKLNSESESKSE